jgi:DNA repair protein RecO (recombination protein O)
LGDAEADAVSALLKIMQPAELEEIQLNAASRRRILQGLETYYAYHIQGFGTMRTLPVLREILS